MELLAVDKLVDRPRTIYPQPVESLIIE